MIDQAYENRAPDANEDGALIAGVGLNRETKIYRYLALERYYELIEDGVNALSHLSLWEDPYEAFILRAGNTYLDGAGRKDVYDKFKGVYGQSRTVQEGESDVLWRAMGKRGNTVRIQTRCGKREDNIISSLNRVKRVFRNSPDVRPPFTRESLVLLIEHMDEIVPNPGSANDCRVAIRLYIEVLYPAQ